MNSEDEKIANDKKVLADDAGLLYIANHLSTKRTLIIKRLKKIRQRKRKMKIIPNLRVGNAFLTFLPYCSGVDHMVLDHQNVMVLDH